MFGSSRLPSTVTMIPVVDADLGGSEKRKNENSSGRAGQKKKSKEEGKKKGKQRKKKEKKKTKKTKRKKRKQREKKETKRKVQEKPFTPSPPPSMHADEARQRRNSQSAAAKQRNIGRKGT